jgi:hypothetical protein
MRLPILGLLLAGFVTSITGCQTTKQPTRILPPVVTFIEPAPEPEQPRTDLPTNWFEVKGSTWSFGLPIGFDKLTLELPPGTVSRHHSMQQDLTIDLTTHIRDSDMHDFIMHEFMMNKNITIMQIMEKDKGSKTIVAIHSLSIPPRDGSLDFFVQNDKVVYHLSCHSTAENLKKHASTCFEVMDTLVLK